MDDPLFWDRMVRTEAGCLEWAGARNGKGYGLVQRRRLSSAPLLAHRYAWMLTTGDPGRACVLHRCDNPACCEPAHLFLGTVQDNNADMRQKGRGVAPPVRRWDTCPNGHPYVPENRAPNGTGKSTCRPCKRDRSAG